MKVKTINKSIRSKIEDWLSSISDESLRKRTKDSLLVTGGCIASMLLSEPVNDYDVYIQDMDVLVDLANYYCPGDVLDGRKKEELIKERYPDIDRLEDHYEDGFNSEAIVRLRTLKPTQVKLDIRSQGVRKEISEENKDKKYQVSFISQNAISLTDDIQIVLRFTGTVEEIHKTFDFVHATNYFTMKEGVVTNKEALECILTKELRYQGSLYPITSVIRMKKFINRKWTINAGEILKMIFQISELDLKDIDILEEQLIGVDVAYFSKLIEVLRGIKEEKFVSSYLMSIIDKVFNQHDDSQEDVTE